MIAPLLLLAAQAAPTVAPATRQDCVRAVGSMIQVCGTPPQSDAPPPQNVAASLPQGNYRVPNLSRRGYGPLPGAQADLGGGVRATLRGQASNSRKGRRTKPVATLSVPF